MSTINIPKKYEHLVASVSDERPRNGVWIYLNPGIWNYDMDSTMIHEETAKDALRQLKYCRAKTQES
jgi:ribulose bisphosphate carboxylase small subunit